MKQKQITSYLLLTILVILITACTAGSANPKNAWHTYENQNYRYTINYPQIAPTVPCQQNVKLVLQKNKDLPVYVS